MKLAISLFSGLTDRIPQEKQVTWTQLVRNLSQHEERAGKEGMLWSPTRYKPGATRGKDGVAGICALVLDFDGKITPEEVQAVWRQWEYLIHSTFSHRADRPKFRAVFPLTREVPADEVPAVYARLVARLGLNAADPVCKDVARIYYLPACAPEAVRFAEHHPGAWIDPDDKEAFPDLPEPEPDLDPSGAAGSAALPPGSVPANRPSLEHLLEQALAKVRAGEGRNNSGFWLAGQARDNRYTKDQTQAILTRYQGLVPQTPDPYTLAEALHSVDEVYKEPPREPSGSGRPITLAAPGGTDRPGPDELTATRLEVDAALDRAKEDHGVLFEPQVLADLVRLRRWDPAAWARFRQAAKKLSLSWKDLEGAINGAEPPAAEPAAPADKAARLAGSMLSDCPAPWLKIPPGYVLSDEQTQHLVKDDEGTGSHLESFLPAPLLITGRTRDTLTGAESLVLAWKWQNRPWTSHLVGRDQALWTRQLPLLLQIGFPYLEAQARATVAYLSELEAVNQDVLPHAKVASHLGWQGPLEDAPFLLGSNLVQTDGEVLDSSPLDTARTEGWDEKRVMYHAGTEGAQQLADAFSSRGDYAGWLDTVQELTPYPKVMSTFYAGFAAPLLALFQVSNFILDLSGSTTIGKTTALRVAGSIWGCPDERMPESVVGTWDATRVWTERASHVLNGLPLIMDDTKKAKAKTIADLVYAITSGRGRGRGTIKGIAAVSSWRTILFSSGEQAITSFTQDGGTRTRVLAIRGMPFRERGTETGSFVKRINSQLLRHYGHAGWRFLSWLQKQRPAWDDWQARYDELNEEYTQAHAGAETGRLAGYAAVVDLAGEMAHLALALPWPYRRPLAAIWQDVAEAAADAAGEERALRDILSWANSHEGAFYGRAPADSFGQSKTGSEMLGRWDRVDWKFLGVFPHAIRKALTDMGYSPDAILSGWRDRGWLDHQKGNFHRRVRMPHNGELTYLVVIRREAIDTMTPGEEGQDDL